MYHVLLVLLSLINVYSLRVTATVINVLSVAKVLALVFISILGIWQLIKGGLYKKPEREYAIFLLHRSRR